MALEVHVCLGTLKGWLKTLCLGDVAQAETLELPSDLAATQWSAAQRLQALCSTQSNDRHQEMNLSRFNARLVCTRPALSTA